jgi:hypothetical protein
VQHFVSAGGTKKELLLYDLLFTTWESAFLLYQRKEKSHWQGWEQWIRDYFQQNIRCSLAWEIAGKYFDRRYVEYVTNEIAKEHGPRGDRLFPNESDAWSTLPVSLDQCGLKIGAFQVMQYWEQPLMLAMAEAVAHPSGVVLEVGYGLGLLSNFIQQRDVTSHTIIEAHPGIYSNLLNWCKDKPNVRAVLATWEQWTRTIPDSHFDSIFFDTYPLRKSLMHKNHFPFFSEAQRLLKDGGFFTYYSDEAFHVCPEHQEMLLKYFNEFSVRQVAVDPPVDCEYWHVKGILLIVAKKGAACSAALNAT